jgi:hypothetical protein
MPRDQFQRVVLEMPRSEVEVVLGCPTGQRSWTFPADTAKNYPVNCTLYTQAYYGKPPSTPKDWQMCVSGKIILLFDDKDRVIEKVFADEDGEGTFTKWETESVLGQGVSVFDKLDWSKSSFRKN